jgi:glycine dehydrogenase subunit 1
MAALPGYELVFDGPFFKEFALRGPRPAAEIAGALHKHKILGGYDLGQHYPELKNTSLWAVTEMNSREQIDRLVAALR